MSPHFALPPISHIHGLRHRARYLNMWRECINKGLSSAEARTYADLEMTRLIEIGEINPDGTTVLILPPNPAYAPAKVALIPDAPPVNSPPAEVKPAPGSLLPPRLPFVKGRRVPYAWESADYRGYYGHHARGDWWEGMGD